MIVLGISFVLGLFTGWKLSSPQEVEVPASPTHKIEVPPSKPTLPSTPIVIIPHRPTSTAPVPQKPKITRPQAQPQISITPSNVTPTPPQETRPQEIPPQVEQKLFRVTIGPIEEEEAKKLQEKLANEGKQAFLVPTDGKYKLQLGAFIQKENAQQLVDELKKAGYNPTVEEK